LPLDVSLHEYAKLVRHQSMRMPSCPQILHSKAALRNDTNGLRFVLLSRAANDLMHWIDSRWIVAISRSGSEFRKVCAAGAETDLEVCASHIADALRCSDESGNVVQCTGAAGCEGLP